MVISRKCGKKDIEYLATREEQISSLYYMLSSIFWEINLNDTMQRNYTNKKDDSRPPEFFGKVFQVDYHR